MDDRPHVIGRVASLLRAISEREPAGSTTSDLGRDVNLARPTVHRLLSALAAEGFVDRDEATGRWTLGPEMYLLGSMAAERYDVTDGARDSLRDLARDTGESAFLSVRRGDETVCLAHEEGSFPLRSHVLHVGIRFPLGVASAGLVILAHLPEREVADYLDRVDLEPVRGPVHGSSPLRGRIGQTRLDGYAVNPGLLVEGSWGMGAAVFDRRSQPVWALSLTGVETRFSTARRPVLGAKLLDVAHALGQRLTGQRPARTTHAGD